MASTVVDRCVLSRVPTADEKPALSTFFGQFQDMCRQGSHNQCYKQALEELGKPPVNSRRELMLWLCMAENRCLQKAGLPTKRCRYTELLGRWRYPDGYL